MSVQVVNGVLYGADERIADWVSRRTTGLPFEDYVAMGVMADGKVVAGVVWHHYRGHEIEVSAAADSPRWARKGVLRQLALYPFVQLGCVRVSAFATSDNPRSQRLIEGLGATLEGRLRRAFDGERDILAYSLLRDECRWIPHG
jgi:RimJ/RimL family protein N-acetyltransferase